MILIITTCLLLMSLDQLGASYETQRLLIGGMEHGVDETGDETPGETPLKAIILKWKAQGVLFVCVDA